MDRVLLIRRGGLGDTLLTAPLLRALRRARPDASLHLAGTREYCDVLARYGLVDEALSAEDLWLWQPERARAALARYALVIGDEVSQVDRPLHVARVDSGVPFGLQLARQAGFEPRWPEDASLGEPRPAASDVCVLAPGSGGARKCWPRASWLQLCGELQSAGRRVEVVVGPVEVERDDPRGWSWPDGVSFVVEATPCGLAARLQEAGRFYGNDSGVTHLAAALGVPTTAVFVTTDPGVWAPVGLHVRVVGDGRSTPAVAQVFAG